MKSVVFFGNCQAQAFANVYQAHIAPLYDQHAIYCDSQHLEADAVRQAARLRNADIIVIQQFDFPSPVAADDLKPNVEKYAFPLLVAGFYWPYGRTAHPLNKPEPFIADGPYSAEIGDGYLNRKIKAGVPADQAVADYLALDVGKVANLDRVFEMYVDRQRVRDQQSGISTADFITERFRYEHVFISPAHPNLSLFKHIAGQLYRQMGIPDWVVDDVLERLAETPFTKDALPIHPAVIEHFGLSFADDKTTYSFLREGGYTFEQFARRYMAYEWNVPLAEGLGLAGTNRKQALARLDEGLVLSPHAPAGWRSRSQVLFHLGDHAGALESAAKAVQFGAGDIDMVLNLATVRAATGDSAGAEQDARAAVAMRPNYSSAFRVLAGILDARGNSAEAVAAAREAVRLHPGDAEGHRKLAAILTGRGEVEEAGIVSARADRLVPQDDALADIEAELRLRQAQHDQALTELECAVTDDPADVRAHVLLAEKFHGLKRFPEAEVHARAALSLAPDMISIQHLLGDTLLLQGRAAEALTLLQEMVAFAPDDAQLHRTIGYTFVKLERIPEAASAFRRAMELDPDEPDYQRCLDLISHHLF